MKYIVFGTALALISAGGLSYSSSDASYQADAPLLYTAYTPTTTEAFFVSVSESQEEDIIEPSVEETEEDVLEIDAILSAEITQANKESKPVVPTVPFYSQFTDISAPEWKKIGCGIASLSMLVDFYNTEDVSVNALLAEGIEADAYLSDAGWIHAGLIGIAEDHGLTGESVSLAHLSMRDAFTALEEALAEGPVMASVHYTFEPTNPIPHLVVINGVHDGKVFYNDPAESHGGNSISVTKFQNAWKKRYIEIRPV